MVTSPVSLSSRRSSGIWCEPLPDFRPSSIGVRVGWAKPLNPISLPLGQPGEFEGASSDQVAATRHQGRHAACPTQEGIHESAVKCSIQRVILSASQSGLSLPSHAPLAGDERRVRSGATEPGVDAGPAGTPVSPRILRTCSLADPHPPLERRDPDHVPPWRAAACRLAETPSSTPQHSARRLRFPSMGPLSVGGFDHAKVVRGLVR